MSALDQNIFVASSVFIQFEVDGKTRNLPQDVDPSGNEKKTSFINWSISGFVDRIHAILKFLFQRRRGWSIIGPLFEYGESFYRKLSIFAAQRYFKLLFHKISPGQLF